MTIINAMTYIKLSTTSDTNGNPRRLYVVHASNPLNPDVGATRLAIIVENYNGNEEVRRRYPMATYLTEIDISPAEFKRWKQVKKSQEQSEEEDALEQLKKLADGTQIEIKKKATWERIAKLAADFARSGHVTIAEGAEMALTRYKNSPDHFQ